MSTDRGRAGQCADNQTFATFTLRDGRRLAYAEHGPQDGFPVLGFHGTPNSRLVHLGAKAPWEAGVRLILPDRPGLGRSDYQPNRTLAVWPSDVSELADALAIDRFAVFGVSGGGPHAAACAALLQDRVTALGLVSGAGPWLDEQELDTSITANDAPWVRELLDAGRTGGADMIETFRTSCAADLDALATDQARWLSEWAAAAPEPDQELIADPEIRAMYIDSCREASLEGYLQDVTILFGRPWGFSVCDIQTPAVIWHGELDRTVPPTVAHWIARQLPNSDPRLDANGGHLIVHTLGTEILAALSQRGR